MTHFDIYTSENNLHAKVDGIVKTNCFNSRIVMVDINDIIIHKIKYRPILVEININNTALEFDVIRDIFFVVLMKKFLTF